MGPSAQKRLTESDAAGLAALMAPLLAKRAGWVNVLPVVDDDVDVPATPGVMAMFSKRGPAVPLGTWTTPRDGRRGLERAQIGIQHGAGRRAAALLADRDWPIPDDWLVLSDHARRGVVIGVPEEATPLEVATWLLGALGRLCIPPRRGEIDVYLYDS